MKLIIWLLKPDLLLSLSREEKKSAAVYPNEKSMNIFVFPTLIEDRGDVLLDQFSVKTRMH